MFIRGMFATMRYTNPHLVYYIAPFTCVVPVYEMQIFFTFSG